MTLRITVLCENTVGPLAGTLGEHGFAALLETPETTLLFDTGQGASLLHNAACLGRDLQRVDRVLLSHGHYDHAGGLKPLLQTIGSRPVLAHPELFTPRYRCKDTGAPVCIGIPWQRAELEACGARFDLQAGWREVIPGIFLTGSVPRQHPAETGDAGLFLDPAGTRPDPLVDDQSLAIVTRQGLFLLLGCCHAGLLNTIAHACRQSGCDRVYGLLGGTHLGFSSAGQLQATVAALRGLGVKKLLASHCTGFAAAARLAREFPAAFQPASVGYQIELELA